MSSKEIASKHTEDDNAEKLTLGGYLRSERERRAMSPEMLHQKTGIQLSLIRALENDQRHELPAEVFVRGLIKLYAKALNLDPQQALAMHQSSNGSNPAKDDTLTPRDLLSSETLAESPLFFTKKKLLFTLLFLLLLVLGYLVLISRPFNYSGLQGLLPADQINPPATESAPNMSTPPVSIAPAIQQKLNEREAGSSNIPASTTDELEQNIAEKSAPSAEKDPMPAISPTAANVEQQHTQFKPQVETEVVSGEQTTPEPAKKENPQGEEVAAPAPHHPHTLSATFSEMTWVRVIIDDNQIKEAFFRPASTATWNADQKIEILLGNSGGASRVFDGSPVKLEGSTGKVVHLTLP